MKSPPRGQIQTQEPLNRLFSSMVSLHAVGNRGLLGPEVAIFKTHDNRDPEHKRS